jgi:hypothetical protein
MPLCAEDIPVTNHTTACQHIIHTQVKSQSLEYDIHPVLKSLCFSMVHSLRLQASLQDKRTVSSARYTPAFKPDEREHLRVRPIFHNALSTSTQVKEQPQVLCCFSKKEALHMVILLMRLNIHNMTVTTWTLR